MDPRKEKKRRQIVRAAAEAFAENGFNRTVMADIAVIAGVGKGTLYEYFRSKDELFLAVFDWYGEKIATAARVEIQALSGSAAARIRAYFHATASALAEIREFFSLFMEFWAAASTAASGPALTEAFRGAYAEHRLLLGSLLRDGMESGELRSDLDVEAIAAVLVGALDGLLLQAWLDPSVDPVRWSGSFLDALVPGLLSESGGSV